MTRKELLLIGTALAALFTIAEAALLAFVAICG